MPTPTDRISDAHHAEDRFTIDRTILLKFTSQQSLGRLPIDVRDHVPVTFQFIQSHAEDRFTIDRTILLKFTNQQSLGRLPSMSATTSRSYTASLSSSDSTTSTVSHSATGSESDTNSQRSLSPSVSASYSATSSATGSPSASDSHNTITPSESRQVLCKETAGWLLGRQQLVGNATSCNVSDVVPIQILWLGTKSEGVNGTQLKSMNHLRSSVLGQTSAATTRCPVPATPVISVPYSYWGSTPTLVLPLGGGEVQEVSKTSTAWIYREALPTTSDGEWNVVSPLRLAADIRAYELYSYGLGSPISLEASAQAVSFGLGDPSYPTSNLSFIVHTDTHIAASYGMALRVRISASSVLFCAGPEVIEMWVHLESPPLLIDAEAIASALGATTGSLGGLTGAPSGVVRGGLLSSMSGMIRCEPPALDQPLSFLANPFNIALGREEGQYQRGGIVSGVIVLVVAVAIMSLTMVPGKYWSLRRQPSPSENSPATLDDSPTTLSLWWDAWQFAHFPGIFMAIAAIVGESLVPNSSTLITMPNTTPAEIAAGCVVLVFYFAYVLHLIYAAWKCRGSMVVCKIVEETNAIGVIDGGADGEQCEAPSLKGWKQRAAAWLVTGVEVLPAVCIPTTPHALPSLDEASTKGSQAINSHHQIELTREEFEHLTSIPHLRALLHSSTMDATGRQAIQWFASYLPYIDELNLIWFKVAELALGACLNVIDGIIVDSCFLHGFALLVVSSVCLVLLVWKRPLAIPIQQGVTTAIYLCMTASTGIIVVNMFVHQIPLEQAAQVFFLVTTTVTCLQAAADTLILTLAIRALLSTIPFKDYWRRFLGKMRDLFHIEPSCMEVEDGPPPVFQLHDVDYSEEDLYTPSASSPTNDEEEQDKLFADERSVQEHILMVLEEYEKEEGGLLTAEPILQEYKPELEDELYSEKTVQEPILQEYKLEVEGELYSEKTVRERILQDLQEYEHERDL